jgi:hypothetical protein
MRKATTSRARTSLLGWSPGYKKTRKCHQCESFGLGGWAKGFCTKCAKGKGYIQKKCPECDDKISRHGWAKGFCEKCGKGKGYTSKKCHECDDKIALSGGWGRWAKGFCTKCAKDKGYKRTKSHHKMKDTSETVQAKKPSERHTKPKATIMRCARKADDEKDEKEVAKRRARKSGGNDVDGKEAQDKYQESEQGKAERKEKRRRYSESPKGKDAIKKWEKRRPMRKKYLASAMRKAEQKWKAQVKKWESAKAPVKVEGVALDKDTLFKAWAYYVLDRKCNSNAQ